jgi:hypothetical protein
LSLATRSAWAAIAVSCTPVPVRSQDRDFVRRSATRFLAGANLAEFVDRPVRRDGAGRDRGTHFAEHDRLAAPVANETIGTNKNCGIELVLLGRVRTHGGDVQARVQPRRLDQRFA